MRWMLVGFLFLLVGFLFLLASALSWGDAPARARPASFEELVAGAERVSDPAPLLEPLFARCAADKGEGAQLARRQCEVIRAWHLGRLAGGRFVLIGDASSLQAQPYDAAGRSLT